MKKYLNLIKNTGLFALASISTKLISFIFLPIYTIYLSTEEYAIVDLSVVVQSLIWPILSLSLTEGLLRFGFDKKYDKSSIFSNTLIMIIPGLILGIIVFIFLNVNSVFNSFRFYFLAFYLVVSINSVLSIFSRTLEKMNLIVINSILSCILISIFNILFLVRFKMGINGYFYSLLIGNGISIISYIIFGKFYKYFKLSNYSKSICKDLLIYSIPMIPNTIFWWINSSLDRFALSAMIGLSAVGLYSVSSKISSSLSIFTSIFSQAWSMSAFQEHKEKGVENFFSNIFNIYNSLLIFMTICVIFFSKLIANIMFSKGFYEAWIYIPYLAIAFYFSGLNVFLGSIFTTNKKTNIIFYTTGLGALFNIIFNIIFIKIFGILGAALATAISNVIVYVVRIVSSQKYIKLETNKLLEIIIMILLSITSISRVYSETIVNAIFLIIIVSLDIIYFINHFKNKRVS